MINSRSSPELHQIIGGIPEGPHRECLRLRRLRFKGWASGRTCFSNSTIPTHKGTTCGQAARHHEHRHQGGDSVLTASETIHPERRPLRRRAGPPLRHSPEGCEDDRDSPFCGGRRWCLGGFLRAHLGRLVRSADHVQRRRAQVPNPASGAAAAAASAKAAAPTTDGRWFSLEFPHLFLGQGAVKLLSSTPVDDQHLFEPQVFVFKNDTGNLVSASVYIGRTWVAAPLPKAP